MRRGRNNRKLPAHWLYQFLALPVICELLVPLLMVPLDAGYFLYWYFTGNVGGKWTGLSILVPIILIQNLLAVILCMMAWKRLSLRPIADLGFGGKSRGKELLFGGVLGSLAVVLVLLCMGLLGVAAVDVRRGIFFHPILFIYMAVFVAAGAGEEIVYRGYGMGALLPSEKPALILFLPALFFSVSHISNQGYHVISFVNIALFGLILGYCLWKTGRLWLSMGMHISWNVFQGCIFGCNVSGYPVPSLFHLRFTGAEYISGGSFGLEGSLVTTVVLLAVFVVLAGAFRKTGACFGKNGFMENGQ